jgi:hypothetical protein
MGRIPPSCFCRARRNPPAYSFNKRWVEGASKVRDNKKLTNEVVKLRVVIEE